MKLEKDPAAAFARYRLKILLFVTDSQMISLRYSAPELIQNHHHQQQYIFFSHSETVDRWFGGDLLSINSCDQTIEEI